MAREAFAHTFSVAIHEENDYTSDSSDGSCSTGTTDIHFLENDEFELITFDSKKKKRHRDAENLYQPPKSTTREEKNKWCLDSFQKKSCYLFSATEEDENLCGCGKLKVHHLSDFNNSTSKWDGILQTVKNPTDSFGDLVFNNDNGIAGYAKYVRLSDDTPLELITMLLRNVWELKLPKLIISLVGGNDEMNLSREVDMAMRKSLAKILCSVDTWLFTNGSLNGLAKLGSDVFTQHTEQTRANRNACIGIMPWGSVKERPLLRNRGANLAYKLNEDTSLDADHTHYLLIDNGQRNKFNTELAFRAKLEKFIGKSKRRPVPSVLLLCEGGLAAIDTVYEAISEFPKLSIIILKGSGRAADVFANAFATYGKNTYLERKQSKLRLLTSIQFAIKHAFDLDIRSPELNKAAAKVKSCIEEHSDMIIIHEMVEESVFTIHQSVLHAAQAACHNDHEGKQLFYCLQLAILWDEVDLASRKLLNVEYSRHLQHKAMKKALLSNRVPFVQLLLENGFNISDYLSAKTLETLYAKRVQQRSPLILLLSTTEIYQAHTYQALNLEIIDKLLMEIMEEDYSKCYSRPDHHEESTRARLIDPLQELMIWATLNNMTSMAELFWKLSTKSHIGNALIVGRIYKHLSRMKIYKEVETEYRANAEMFLKFAMDLLTECAKMNENLAKLVIRAPIPLWGHRDCVTIASNINFRKFMVHLVCQHVMNDIYFGRIQKAIDDDDGLEPLVAKYLTRRRRLIHATSHAKENLKPDYQRFMSKESAMSSKIQSTSYNSNSYNSNRMPEPYAVRPSLTPLSHSNGLRIPSDSYSPNLPRKVKDHAYLSSKDSYQSTPLSHVEPELRSPAFDLWLKSKNVKEDNCCSAFTGVFWWLLNYFGFIPKGKMILHVFIYLVFTGLFTYMVLRGHIADRTRSVEYICLVFIVAFTLDEIRQWIEIRKPSKWAKLVLYLRDQWNVLDWLAILFFYVGFAFRSYGEELSEVGHVLYATDNIFWFLKLFQFYRMSSVLGPYVVMIYRMLRHVVAFFAVMLVGMLAYGVFQSAVLFHKSNDNHWILFKTLFKPYILLYGEVSASLEGDTSNIFSSAGNVARYREIIVLIALGGYLVFANILLLNLIIAVFNNIYQDVKSHSDEIWMTEKFNLIVEIDRRPMLPIPLSIFENIYRLAELSCRVEKHPTIDHDLEQELLEFEARCFRVYLDKQMEEKKPAPTEKLLQDIRERQDILDKKLDYVQTLLKDKNKIVGRPIVFSH